MELKKTALTHIHESLNAKMVPFAGYNMPVRYTSEVEEHLHVRNHAGVFDVSHMGEFMLRGPKALALIQRVTSNDAGKLYDGKAQYSCLPNEQGGIVDDLLVYRIHEEEYMLVVNAANIQKDWDWISSFNTEGVEMENISDNISLLAVQGPKATDILQQHTDVALNEMPFYTFQKGVFAGEQDVIISATGYTGAGGFELYIPNQAAEQVWNTLFSDAATTGLKPIGLAARDTLRLEMGFCLYGNDIDDTTSPIEGGLGWITKFTKEFVNSEALLKQKEEGTTRRLTGFKMMEKGIPRQGYTILNEAGEEIGKVTSGTMSPSLGIGVGLGYFNTGNHKSGTEVFIQVRKRRLKAQVQRPPFIG